MPAGHLIAGMARSYGDQTKIFLNMNNNNCNNGIQNGNC